MKKQIEGMTLEIEKSGRGYKGALYYDNPAGALTEVKGKTEADVIEAARAWIAKRTPKKVLIACARCKNGVELEKKTTKGVMEIRCSACGAVNYRGTPIEWA